MNSKKISDFQKGEKIESFFLVKDISCKLTNGSNNKFLDMTLVDKSGDINGKLWDCKNDIENSIKDFSIVHVKGNIIEWKGKLQFKVDCIRSTTKDDKINVDDFVPSAPYDYKEMFDLVLDYRDKIENNDIKSLVTLILDEAGSDIMHFPAAKSNHHAIRGGLLYHTTTMLKAGEKLSEVYTYINTDLLFAGIILHDICKMEEMVANELGIVSEYSVEGQLLGHIAMGVRRIEMAANKIGIDKEIAIILEHMILSHHYYPEYGSPKKPMIPEAELLHHLDMIDARMYDMEKALKETNVGEFSDRIWSLDNLSLYKSKFSKI